MNELSAVNQAIRAKLVAETEVTTVVSTRVYADEIPQEAALPAVVFNYVTEESEQGVGTKRQMSEIVMQIKLVVEDALTAAHRTAVNRIDTVFSELSSYVVTVTGTGETFTVSARRERTNGIVHMFERDALTKKKYTHRGSRHRFYVSAA
jgi:hypothetical protein